MKKDKQDSELCLLLVSTAMATIVIIGLVIYGGYDAIS